MLPLNQVLINVKFRRELGRTFFIGRQCWISVCDDYKCQVQNCNNTCVQGE